MIAQEQSSSLGTGPLEVDSPEFFAGSAQAFACGFLGTFDQATIGDKILHPGEAVNAVNIVDFVEQLVAEDLADTGHSCNRYRVLASCCLAVCKMASVRALSSSSSEVMSARSTSLVLCTARSAKRAAMPARVALEAIC